MWAIQLQNCVKLHYMPQYLDEKHIILDPTYS